VDLLAAAEAAEETCWSERYRIVICVPYTIFYWNEGINEIILNLAVAQFVYGEINLKSGSGQGATS
jgi:hypothetical protein